MRIYNFEQLRTSEKMLKYVIYLLCFVVCWSEGIQNCSFKENFVLKKSNFDLSCINVCHRSGDEEVLKFICCIGITKNIKDNYYVCLLRKATYETAGSTLISKNGSSQGLQCLVFNTITSERDDILEYDCSSNPFAINLRDYEDIKWIDPQLQHGGFTFLDKYCLENGSLPDTKFQNSRHNGTTWFHDHGKNCSENGSYSEITTASHISPTESYTSGSSTERSKERSISEKTTVSQTSPTAAYTSGSSSTQQSSENGSNSEITTDCHISPTESYTSGPSTEHILELSQALTEIDRLLDELFQRTEATAIFRFLLRVDNLLQTTSIAGENQIHSNSTEIISVFLNDSSLRFLPRFKSTAVIGRLTVHPYGSTNNIVAVATYIKLSGIKSISNEIKSISNEIITGRKKSDTSVGSTNHKTATFLLDYLPFISVSILERETRNVINARVSYSLYLPNSTDEIEQLASRVKNTTMFSQKNIISDIKYLCEHYNASLDSFQSNGCKPPDTKNNKLTCDCNHTTIFAVLLSVKYYTIPRAVKLASFVTESISILALMGTIVILSKAKKRIMSERTYIQINLAVGLLLLHVCNIFYDLAETNDRACEMIAILIHFFILLTACWMFLEGFHLLMKTTDRALSFGKQNPKVVARMTVLVGWSVPFIIVTVSAAVGFSTEVTYLPVYLNGYNQCWLNDETNILIGSLIIPFAVIYGINVLIMLKVANFVYKMSSDSERFKPLHERKNVEAARLPNVDHVKATLKSVLILFPVLGVPWIFSFLSGVEAYEAKEVFMYFNVILNGLQGLFLFLVYCVVGKEVRTYCTSQLRRSKFLSWIELETIKKTSNDLSLEMTDKSSK